MQGNPANMVINVNLTHKIFLKRKYLINRKQCIPGLKLIIMVKLKYCTICKLVDGLMLFCDLQYQV